MLKRKTKRRILWGVLGAFVIAVVTGPLALPAPVPVEEYQQCTQAAKERHQKNPDCKTNETLGERALRDPIAYFTLWLTIFTAILGAVGLTQILMLRDEFLATHRPRIRIRQILTQNFSDANRSFEVGFHCINIGNSPCTVEEIAYQARPAAFARMPILVPGQFQRETSVQKGTRFDGGEGALATTPSITVPHIVNRQWDFAGYVVYRDDDNIVRRTGFWQRFDDRAGEQVETPDSWDYKYED